MFIKGFTYGWDGRRGAYQTPEAVLSMERLAALTGVPIPKNLTGLKELEELHTGVIPKEEMLSFVLGE